MPKKNSKKNQKKKFFSLFQKTCKILKNALITLIGIRNAYFHFLPFFKKCKNFQDTNNNREEEEVIDVTLKKQTIKQLFDGCDTLSEARYAEQLLRGAHPHKEDTLALSPHHTLSRSCRFFTDIYCNTCSICASIKQHWPPKWRPSLRWEMGIFRWETIWKREKMIIFSRNDKKIRKLIFISTKKIKNWKNWKKVFFK